MLPARAHGDESATYFYLGEFRIRSRHYGGGLAFGQFEKLPIANQVGDAEVWHSGLPCAEEFPRPSQFEIEFGDLKTVAGAGHSVEAPLAVFRDFASGHQNAKRLCRSAADAPAQLVKLGETEALGVLDHHYGRIRHIDTDLDDGGRDQNLQLAFLEHAHDLIF